MSTNAYRKCIDCGLTQGQHTNYCPNHPDSWLGFTEALQRMGTNQSGPSYDASMYDGPHSFAETPTEREHLAELAALSVESGSLELNALAQRLGMRLIPLADGVTLIIDGGKNGR